MNKLAPIMIGNGRLITFNWKKTSRPSDDNAAVFMVVVINRFFTFTPSFLSHWYTCLLVEKLNFMDDWKLVDQSLLVRAIYLLLIYFILYESHFIPKGFRHKLNNNFTFPFLWRDCDCLQYFICMNRLSYYRNMKPISKDCLGKRKRKAFCMKIIYVSRKAYNAL